VYWHGVFPDPNRQGTVVRPGAIRHEILWDDSDAATLTFQNAVAKVVGGLPVCPYKPRCGYCS
jgi:hypothetical protein